MQDQIGQPPAEASVGELEGKSDKGCRDGNWKEENYGENF